MYYDPAHRTPLTYHPQKKIPVFSTNFLFLGFSSTWELYWEGDSPKQSLNYFTSTAMLRLGFSTWEWSSNGRMRISLTSPSLEFGQQESGALAKQEISCACISLGFPVFAWNFPTAILYRFNSLRTCVKCKTESYDQLVGLQIKSSKDGHFVAIEPICRNK